MYDRVAANPGRYKITFEDPNLGEKYGVLSLADNPTQQGTPLNSMTLASNEVLDKAGLLPSGTPTELFDAILDLLADTGWLEVSPGPQFVLYSSNAPIRYRKVGKMVEVIGCVKPANAIAGSTTQYTICTLPTGFRPPYQLDLVSQGSNNAIWLCRFNTNGTITFSRYRTMAASDTGYSNATNNAYLPFHFTFLV